MLTAAVVTEDGGSGEGLRACLEQTGLVCYVRVWKLASGATASPNPAGPPPDVVLLDLSRNTDPYFDFATQARRINPTVRVIAVSATPNPESELLLRAMRSGIQDVLHKPIKPEALRAILAPVLEEKGSTVAGSVEKVIMVLGAKGGVGATTVAINLSIQLALASKKKIVLLDLARPLGHIPLMLDLRPGFSVRDAVENVERLDSHFFGGLLSHHESGVEVLAGVSNPEEWQMAPITALLPVVNVAQSAFDFVVADCGSYYTPEWAPVLRLAKAVVLVAEVNVPSLWALERHTSTLSGLGIDAGKFRVVINRWRREDEEAVKTLEKNSKRSVFARLPNDFRLVSQAINQGIPLTATPKNSVVGAYRMLATELTEGQHDAPAKGKVAAGLSLLPFSIRS